ALRIDVPASAKGKASFTYQASDGAALAMSTVDVEVSPWSQNRPPAQIRDPGVKLGGSANAEVTYNALPDWRDPDGDPVYLASVKAPEGLEVQFSEQGTLTIRNLGAKTGSAQIEVSVSDGTLSANGHVTVQVQQPGNIRPTANGDFVVARVGEPSLVQPLANDTDPNGDPLTLVGVSGLPKDAVIVQDLDLGTVSFTARAPGTYTFFYTVSDGPTNAVGVIRIDAVQADISAAPVAEDDLALLPPNGAVLAAPLNNDT
ncbi:MAG TPA: fibronectin type III domain-containing protein, partial [Propionibacteriaceae bacterium]|nr:fibronectin type III domain-containing protein [Propionibacteriaceae bacterium]